MKTYSQPVPHFHFGGEGRVFHFLHANGYPTGSYSQMLNSWTEHGQVWGMAHRPLWPSTNQVGVKNWEIFADDLIRFLDERKFGPVIGVGHSLGATASFMAAAKRPDLFSHLVLMEPVFLPKRILLLKYLVPFFLRKFLIPPARVSNKRRFQWKDKQEAFDFFRSKRPFALINDLILKDYVQYGTRSIPGGGVELAWSREWETHIYAHMDNPWKALAICEVPTLIIRGDRSNTLFPDAWASLKTTVPNGTFVELENASHLLPFEYPEVVTQAMLEFLG